MSRKVLQAATPAEAKVPALVRSDQELKQMLVDIRSKQRNLVAPIFLSFVLALQPYVQTLAFLQPIGWYGGIHCASLWLFALWQDVSEVGRVRDRSRHHAHAYLALSSAGFAFCAACCAGQEDMLLTLVLVFLLPLTSTWEVRNLEASDTTCFYSYLALHLAMVVAQLRATFFHNGWKVCVALLIFDGWLVFLVKDRQHSRQQILEGTCTTVRRLLATVCDACCIISTSGEIILADTRLADLIGGPETLGFSIPEEFDGLPFESIIHSDAPEEGSSSVGKLLNAAPVREGVRTAKLKPGPGLPPMDVEIYMVRCSMPPEVASLVLGRTAHVPMVGRGSYVCMIRQSVGGAGAAPGSSPQPFGGLRTSNAKELEPPEARLSAATLEQLRLSAEKAYRPPSEISAGGGGGGSALGSRFAGAGLRAPNQMGGSSEVSGWAGGSQLGVGRCAVSEVGRCSDVSGFSAMSSSMSTVRQESASALANRRLQLMGSGGRMLDRGTPMILELDIPASEVSSIVSEAVSNAQLNGAGGVPKPLNVRMRMQGGSRSMRSSDAPGNGSSSSGEEMETTEVRHIGTPSADGTVRVQVAFRSQRLLQQQARLDSSEMELRRARRDLTLRNQVQEEQKTVLKNFKKIVSREFDEIDEDQLRAVSVFIFDSRETVRAKLVELCARGGWTCRVFHDIAQGKSELSEASGLSDIGGGLQQAPDASRLRQPTWTRQPSAQLVLLGAPLLAQLRAEWCEAGIFVVLVSGEDELESLGKYLGASSEVELRDTLRALGVSEHIEVPLPVDRLRSLAESTLRHRLAGDYLLVQQFGRGATGPVYGAKRIRDGEIFALKEVNTAKVVRKPGKLGDQAPAFEWKEVEILASTKWPTVMNLIDTWAVNGGKLTYVLMPALLGGSLADQVEKAARSQKPPAPDHICEWYAQTLHAVAYLHWCGVLHRDIKTDNLLLDINLRSLKLTDFGSAVMLPGLGPHPKRRSCLQGDVTTVRITSPEVFAKGLWYPGSDIWQVGATFYEIMSLQPLLSADRPSDELLEIASAMDVLTELREAAASANDVSDSSYRLPEDLVSSYSKLLREPNPISALTAELSELLRRSPLSRPTASELCARPRTSNDLRRALEAGAVWDRTARLRHLLEFDRVIAESNAAANQDPPSLPEGAVED